MSAQKVAIVTGSRKGLGYAIVQSLCQKFDGQVYITCRKENQGQEAVRKLQAEGFKPRFHQIDVNDASSIEKLKDYMVSRYGGIDVLVNNAGILFKPTEKIPLYEQAEETIKTNYFGTVQTSNILLPFIKKNGRMVHIASTVGITALKYCSQDVKDAFRSEELTEDGLSSLMNTFVSLTETTSHIENGYPSSPYGISKLGLMALARVQAKLLRQQGRDNILVNSCCPGWVRTDMTTPKAPKSPEEGAITPVYLSLIAEGEKDPNGQYVVGKKVRKW